MQNRALNFGFGTTAVALLAAWTGRGAHERKADSAKRAPAVAEEAAAWSRPGASPPLEDSIVTGTALLEKFFGDSLDSLRACAERAPCYDLDFLIVMLPDPLDSFLDWSFDADLESMRRALESARYVTDRFWLPWDEDRRGGGGGGDSDSHALEHLFAGADGYLRVDRRGAAVPRQALT